MAMLTCFTTDVTAGLNFVSSKDNLVVYFRRRSYERGRNVHNPSDW